MTYITHMSDFHGRCILYRGPDVHAAFRHATCGGDCRCGGGTVSASGTAEELRGAYRTDGGHGPLVIDHPIYGPIMLAAGEQG